MLAACVHTTTGSPSTASAQREHGGRPPRWRSRGPTRRLRGDVAELEVGPRAVRTGAGRVASAEADPPDEGAVVLHDELAGPVGRHRGQLGVERRPVATPAEVAVDLVVRTEVEEGLPVAGLGRAQDQPRACGSAASGQSTVRGATMHRG